VNRLRIVGAGAVIALASGLGLVRYVDGADARATAGVELVPILTVGSDVDELVQSTFLACVRAKNNFRGDSSFATYLFTIARHELYRVLSERRRDLSRIDFEVSSVAELAPTPRTRIAAQEDRLRLLHALRDLPVEQQVLLELHYWEGQDAADLGKVFDMPAGSIRSRLSRAREALRERMMKDADTAPAITDSLESLDAWARGLAQ
jgi:RNA polymerase sigma-70 factor (ECF subfamily)